MQLVRVNHFSTNFLDTQIINQLVVLFLRWLQIGVILQCNELVTNHLQLLLLFLCGAMHADLTVIEYLCFLLHHPSALPRLRLSHEPACFLVKDPAFWRVSLPGHVSLIAAHCRCQCTLSFAEVRSNRFGSPWTILIQLD